MYYRFFPRWLQGALHTFTNIPEDELSVAWRKVVEGRSEGVEREGRSLQNEELKSPFAKPANGAPKFSFRTYAPGHPPGDFRSGGHRYIILFIYYRSETSEPASRVGIPGGVEETRKERV